MAHTSNGSDDGKEGKIRNTLYINNLNEKVSTRKLRISLYMMFSTYGEVLKIYINFKRQRGQAFVTLRTPEEAQLAKVSLQGEIFFDKELHIDFSKANSAV